MRFLILVCLIGASIGCPITEATDAKKEPEIKPLPPIEVKALGPVLATIDPATLEVTYKKGADPKVFADEMVKAWAAATANLNQCQTQLKVFQDKKEK